MSIASIFKQQSVRTTGVVFAAVLTLVLAACGGGNSQTAGPTSDIAATPTASATSGDAPMEVMFTATNPRGSIASYEWNFKDNSPIAIGQSVSHSFVDSGMYDVTLTVRDAKGNYNRANVAVTISGGSPACVSAKATFAKTVWPAMTTTCTTCHVSGGAASGSGFVLAGGAAAQNFNIVSAYAKKDDVALLGKAIGQLNHDGGAPFGNTNDQRYKDLAALLPAMKTACDTTTTAGPTTAKYWEGVTFASDSKVLGRAAIIFAGRNPTAAEEAAVMSGGKPVLRQTIRGYMQGPAFDAFLDETAETHFLARGTQILGNGVGYVAADWPSATNIINNTNLQAGERNRFIAGSRAEQAELLKYIVRNDKPWTDIVAGKYTMVNAIVAQYMQANVTGTFADPMNDTVFLPATLPNQRLGGMRDHSGVISMQSWLERHPTTPTNRNRHRVKTALMQFLGTDVTLLAQRPIDGSNNFKIPTVEDPNCNVCHNVIDPMAAGWQNFQENNRDRPFRDAMGKDIALPATYRSNNYPKDANGQSYYKVGDNWFRDEKEPGYGTTPMPGGVTGNPNALSWLGQQLANDERFPIGASYFWYKAIVGRDALQAPVDASTPEGAARLAAFNAQNEEFQEIAARFKTDRGSGAYNVRDLLVDLMTSKVLTAESATNVTATRMIELGEIGGFALLNPIAVNRKMVALTGQAIPEFNNPTVGFGLAFGDFDGVNRLKRPTDYTMMQAIAMYRAGATRSCSIVMNDAAKTQGTRLLLPMVQLTDTPATPAGQVQIQANIAYMMKHLWKEDVGTSDPEAQRAYALLLKVWNDRATPSAKPTTCAFNNTNDANYMGRAWSTVVAYMIGDYRFIIE